MQLNFDAELRLCFLVFRRRPMPTRQLYKSRAKSIVSVVERTLFSPDYSTDEGCFRDRPRRRFRCKSGHFSEETAPSLVH
jgi:hypothetical protein